MSAPSTPCTPPPGHWPSAATRCSRSRSRRCAGSVSAPGGSARSPPPPSSCSTTSTAAPHDQQAREAVTGNGSLTVSDGVKPRLCATYCCQQRGKECQNGAVHSRHRPLYASSAPPSRFTPLLITEILALRHLNMF